MIPSTRVLPFACETDTSERRVGRVHRDGSITFRGETYPTIKHVPPECLALLPDLETYKEWKRIYDAIAPPGWRRPPRLGLSLVDSGDL